MTKTRIARSIWFLGGIVGCCLLVGCEAKPPEIVAAGGTVTLNGKPLADASVSFIPMAEGLSGNFTASGVTDKEGKFTLSLPGKTEPGCCACECRVMVTEGPLPDAAYVQNDAGMKALFAYKSKLKNRPIPDLYQRMSTTPLSFTISETESNTELELELKR